MIVPLEKPGTPEELVHFGVKGMRWGVRKERTAAEQVVYEHRKSVAKKVAIGVGVAAVVVGTAFVVYKLNKAEKLPFSSVRRASSGGKMYKNIDEAIAAKRASQGVAKVLQTTGDKHLPDPKLLAEHQSTIKRLSKQADWSVNWNDIFKKTHGVSASEHPDSVIKWS